MRTSSRKFAVLLFDEVELLDVAGVQQVASIAGRHWNWRPFAMQMVAKTAGPIATRNQVRLLAEHVLADLPRPEMLYIPGGYGARKAAECEQTLSYVKHAAAHAELLVACGAGVGLLARCGLLEGLSVACAAEHRSWLTPLARARWEDRGVCSAGRIITARSGAYSIELGLTVVERCLGKSGAARLRKEVLPDPTDPISVRPSQLAVAPAKAK